MKKTRYLRQLLEKDEILVLPGGGTPLVCIIAEKLGFKSIYMSGYGTAALQLGLPDIGLMTMTEALNQAKNMAQATNLPLISDIDTGYGNAINVKRAVREYELAGISGIQMEDQAWPKKCGHMEEKKLIPADEMVGKIRAAVDAKIDKDFLIIARTDARTVMGFKEAIDRANLYADAGADVIFVESPLTEEEVKEIPKLVKAPVMINMSEGAKTPIFSNQELQKMGYKIVVWPSSVTWSIAATIKKTLEELKKHGTTNNILNEMITFKDFNELLGLENIINDTKKYEKV